MDFGTNWIDVPWQIMASNFTICYEFYNRSRHFNFEFISFIKVFDNYHSQLVRIKTVGKVYLNKAAHNDQYTCTHAFDLVHTFQPDYRNTFWFINNERTLWFLFYLSSGISYKIIEHVGIWNYWPRDWFFFIPGFGSIDGQNKYKSFKTIQWA